MLSTSGLRCHVSYGSLDHAPSASTQYNKHDTTVFMAEASDLYLPDDQQILCDMSVEYHTSAHNMTLVTLDHNKDAHVRTLCIKRTLVLLHILAHAYAPSLVLCGSVG